MRCHPDSFYSVPTRHAVSGMPTLAQAVRFWFKLGFISFGGPTGQIAIMYTELVDKKRWISESRFLHALNYCMLLPGPEAQQLATYVGWLLHGTAGALAAGSLFVLPSAALLWILSYVYMSFGNVPLIGAVFYGLKPAVVAIVAHAVLRIGKRALRNPVMWTVAGLAFIAIFFLKAPFPLIIFAAALIGLLGSRIAPKSFQVLKPHAPTAGTPTSVLDDQHETPARARFSTTRALKVVIVSVALWWTPVLLAGTVLGWNHTLTQEGLFFSKAAMVTFGGAYAVLPYVAQQAVDHYAWLAPGQMLDGLGLAETTPGPLIMVVQFVGFVGGWNHPGPLAPLLAATLCAIMTTWVTFVPCFLWILLGAPYIESLRGQVRLSAALSTITAAVVGVVLNLAVWFAMHVLFPREGHTDWLAVIVAATGFLMLAKTKIGVVGVVFAGGALGLLWHFIGPVP
ncbi:MAG: chromate efflux transporter [Phycisphaerales bacterium]|nr:chromate efflux transporter [Phycisphaerales bacterium]